MEASFDLVVTNGRVVTATDSGFYDVGVKDGKIALLAPRGALLTAKTTRLIDAEGGMVMVRTRSRNAACVPS